MGQSVSQQLGVGALGAGVDPDYLRSQILQQREKQLQSIANPQQQLAARLGGLLGGGISNLSQDRGFFDINDPLLNKVTQIQGIYNQVASQIDPAANPEQFFTQLQAAYKDAGLGQQALMAAQEAQKAKTAGMDVQIKEAQLYEKDPTLLIGKIEEARNQGNEGLATRLEAMKKRFDEDRLLSVTKSKADIERLKAQTNEAYDRIQSGKYEWKIVTNEANVPVGVQTLNKKTGELEFKEIDPEMAKKFYSNAPKATPSGDQKGTKKALSEFGAAPEPAPQRKTTWSGVPINEPATVPLTPIQERDYAIQRAMPNVNVTLLNEAQKAVLAQQLGL